jgi:MFS family permease
MAAPPVGSTSPIVVRAYLTLSATFTLSASVIWGVNTLFLLDAGLDIFEVFVVNSAYTAGMVLFEVPTGVVADTAGRRRSFLLATAILAVGTLGYVVCAALETGVVPFVVASLVLGLGFSFYSGAVEAWLVDALHATGYEQQLDGVFAKGSMASGAAMIIGSVAGGLLGEVGLAWPFVVRAGLLVAAFAVGWRSMHDIGFTPRTTSLHDLPVETRRVWDASIQHGWRNRSVRLLMIVTGLQGGFLMWAFYAWQPYLLELLDSDSVVIAGVVAALISLSTIGGNLLVEYFTRFCGKRTTLLLWAAVVMAAGSIGIGLVGTFWAAVLCLLVTMGASGVGQPVQQAYLHAVIPSSQRATVVSSVSLFGSAGGIGGQLGLGYLARARSVPTAYVVGGLGALLAVRPLLRLRRLGERADRLIGRRAGKRGPCAAQGLPDVASVDATPRQPTSV